ncbi:hybrid sensor histidine kinase/response regulator [Methylobacterium gnaphalii]|uniref:histidine kinase n=1 Tax=Methylobacterium gnaphalii TaxID=1010610 RepID=A0A512JQ51_9HYPH|nr:ATP-binding protein [Methylobacterium gnaphalii]GEP12071.1 hybrid sensor histidine kinase/response regulator [Methylobacterium gnaphalii]GJD70720.1 Sensor histidine kinase RcsC [Methylobacterium gnaphalii]GLS48662.1 hybrid sensor histidine kinase/response regulator [Methylobacterium gnaphalii]
MNARPILPNRRAYNRFVADETLEDYALRFTAKSARLWSPFRIAQTALGSISFLALEAIGGTLVLATGFTNTLAAVLVVGLIIFATAVPISVYAARHGVDIDLLTRGAGFGYLGSTITSLIYAGFTFLFFAIEAGIMALALQLCLGLPLWIGYVVSAGVVIPLVIYGIRLISRFQLWTQPLWIGLNLLPLVYIAASGPPPLETLLSFSGAQMKGTGFDPTLFGLASGILLALLAQVGEQVDFLRFVPPPKEKNDWRWWTAVLLAGAGWIVPGMLKILLGAFLTVLALHHGVPPDRAAEPTQMYAVAFGYVSASPGVALALTGLFVVVSQLKINVTNAYAGSIAWSNFFSRLTHSHPGRVVWLVFNVAIALLLMELGIDKTIESTLPLYACVVSGWVGALAADLAVNKPLGLSPPGIEFRRAHLYAINPVGAGAMALSLLAGCLAHAGLLGGTLQPFAPMLALAVAFTAAPAIARTTGGRHYLARQPETHWPTSEIVCRVCDHPFEAEDMARCPAYSGPICSLCCSLDARCRDMCKPHGRLEAQAREAIEQVAPAAAAAWIGAPLGRYVALMLALVTVVGLILGVVHAGAAATHPEHRDSLRAALTSVFFILIVILGVVAWLFVLAQESRRVAQEETARQTALYEGEIAAHRITDAKLQEAKDTAEAANLAKSRYVVGISHELRTPLNAVLGYAQLLEADPEIPAQRRRGVQVIRRSAQHLSGLIDGLLDISRMEAGRLQVYRNEIRLNDFLDQIVDMVRLQAEAAGLAFRFTRPESLPAVVATDEKRLRQILLNLLSNAIKFTPSGEVALDLRYRNQVMVFTISDTGLGIHPDDLQRIFEPFERGSIAAARNTPGTGLGLTIAHLLAQVMGGEITVKSEVGTGTRFQVRLMLSSVSRPAAAPAAIAASPVSKEAARNYAGRRRKVMIVDDDEAHRVLMRDVMEPLGIEVTEAPDGATCLTRCAAEPPDLVLLDISMPGMSGWAVAERLRALAPSTRIAMMSANVHEISPTRGADAPHDAIIAKPFDLRDFIDQLTRMLDLDWMEAAPTAPPEAPPPAGTPPPRQAVEELLRLGRIGHVRAIEAKLADIAREDTASAAFAARLQGLVAAYDLPTYMRVLEEVADA